MFQILPGVNTNVQISQTSPDFTLVPNQCNVQLSPSVKIFYVLFVLSDTFQLERTPGLTSPDLKIQDCYSTHQQH